MFHRKMPTMASRMLPKVMSMAAIMGEAMRHVRSILRMPAWALIVHQAGLNSAEAS